MRKTAEKGAWIQDLEQGMFLIINTIGNSIELFEEYTKPELLQIWRYDSEPTVGDFGKVMEEVAQRYKLELV